MIKVSVVIPTFNRGDKILNTLKSLAKQTFEEFEVLIVNDGSTDNTREILDAIDVEAYPFRLVIQHQENMGRAGSRNVGFSGAKAEIIVSIDDDIRPEPEFLQVHYDHHQQVKDSILVGGLREDPALAQTDIQKYLAHARIGWQEVLEKVSKPMKRNEVYITAANFSISKTLFEQIGGFDSRLRAVIDYDLAMRAFNLHIPIYYNSRAFAWHDDFITCKSYIKRRRQSTENEEALFKLKPELIQSFHRYKDPAPSKLKMMIYYVFAKKFFVNSIDANFYSYLLPAKVRFKFYALVITALSKYYPDRTV